VLVADGVDPAVPHAGVGRLPARGRALRVLVLAVGLALLLLGTLRGSDDAFPFGPFRMYATADDPDGRVLSTYVQAVDAAGVVLPRLGEGEVGLRRAEYEGQLGRVVADPAMLQDLARAFARRHPDRSPLVELSVVQTAHQLVDGAPVGESTAVLATWRAS
jgi:hypothetical protein